MFSQSVLELLNKIKGVSVLCVGDIMLDRYIYGQASRLSPEAPVPVVKVKKRLFMPGGVGNVIKNLGSLGTLPVAVTVTGNDKKADDLARLFLSGGFSPPVLIRDNSRPTIVKTRILAGIQQVVRFDEEEIIPVSREIEDAFLEAVERFIANSRAVAISDYGKGTLTPRVLEQVISMAARRKIPVVVDPKGSDYARYSGADLITPNRNELSEAVGHQVESFEDIAASGQKLMAGHNIKNLLVTLSENGMMLLDKNSSLVLPTVAKEVYDVSGAGDTVVAAVTASLAAGAGLPLAARLATLAAGIVVGKVGTAVATSEEIREAVKEHDWLADSNS